jgi:hypothetical protein
MRKARHAVVVLLMGCAVPVWEHDPRAVAPRYDRWEAVVRVPADSAYTVALGVVLEAGYTVSVASRADRVITTHLRRQDAGTGFKRIGAPPALHGFGVAGRDRFGPDSGSGRHLLRP